MTLTLWIFELLLIGLTSAHGLHHFPENFVLAKRNDSNSVLLRCDAGDVVGDVTWKYDDEVIEDEDDSFQQEGQNLRVSDVDVPVLGEYSCWRGEEMLSSTYLLLEADEEQDSDSLLSCWARSYHCNFSCKWTNSRYTAVRLGLGHECFDGGKSCQWVSSADGGFQFDLSHPLSPYAEEITMLEITAEAIVNLSIVRITKRFYLRDIVQPDSPEIVTCTMEQEDLNVTIDPPSTWSTPHSFFRLQHEIEYVQKDNGKIGRSMSTMIPKRVSKLRVRSRDSLVVSNWSQWTPWKNVMTRRKKSCKCRNTATFCCPSGYLDHCESRRVRKRNKNNQSTQVS